MKRRDTYYLQIFRIQKVHLIYIHFSEKKNIRLDSYIKTMKQDFNRITRLLVQGRFRQIISPNRTDTPNNYQKIVKLSNHLIKTTLKRTLNTTIQDIGRMAVEIPKNMTKNIICFKPNLLRVWRQHQAMQKMTNPGRQILRGIKNTGTILKIF